MKVPKSVAYECLKEFTNNYDIRDKVSRIKVPTIIIVGDKDKSTPVGDESVFK
jgi:pimeloyl-ACP methyl ester carboxylesterase